jgi:ribose transport system ATP-binding protein
MLRIFHLDKSFGVVKALKDVSFAIHKGEVHGLIGENGSGKSTLSSILAGMQKADKGEMELLGNSYRPENAIEAAAGVSIVVQEIGTISGITAAENLFLGREERFCRHGLISPRKMNALADSIFYPLTSP